MIDVNIDTYFIKTNTKTISITSSTYFKSMVLSLLRQVNINSDFLKAVFHKFYLVHS